MGLTQKPRAYVYMMKVGQNADEMPPRRRSPDIPEEFRMRRQRPSVKMYRVGLFVVMHVK